MHHREIVVLAYQGAQILDIAGPTEVFTAADAYAARREYRVRVATADGTDVVTSSGVRLAVDGSISQLTGPIDTLIVPGGPAWPEAAADRAILDALRATVPRCRRVASVCAGAFVLGAVGLLDGRRATTHWLFTDELARRHPAADVQDDAIFVVDGAVHTSAGVTAGIDLALAMVETDLGPDAAREVARFLVVFMQRPGGQSQFSARLRTEPAGPSTFRELLDTIAENPAADYRLEALSARVGYAERHITRVFVKELGTTPARYVEQVRVEAAKAMLETTDLPLETIARETGFGSPDTLRRSFTRVAGIAPMEHRRRFRTTGVRITPGHDEAPTPAHDLRPPPTPPAPASGAPDRGTPPPR